MSNQISISRTEYVLSTDGKIIKRQITESEKELTAEQLAELAEQKTVYWPGIFPHPDTEPIAIGINKSVMTMTAKLKRVRIKTNYKIHDDDALVPAFNRPSEPLFDITWTPPVDMLVYFVVQLGGGNTTFTSAHLLAVDDDKRCYRLPLGNLYANGQICLGREYRSSESATTLFFAVFEQFDKSQWNNDLEQTNDTLAIQKLFRFKLHGDDFKQLDATDQWKSLCTIIAPPILNFIKI